MGGAIVYIVSRLVAAQRRIASLEQHVTKKVNEDVVDGLAAKISSIQADTQMILTGLAAKLENALQPAYPVYQEYAREVDEVDAEVDEEDEVDAEVEEEEVEENEVEEVEEDEVDEEDEEELDKIEVPVERVPAGLQNPDVPVQRFDPVKVKDMEARRPVVPVERTLADLPEDQQPVEKLCVPEVYMEAPPGDIEGKTQEREVPAPDADVKPKRGRRKKN